MDRTTETPGGARFLRLYLLAGAGWMLFCLPLIDAVAHGEISDSLASVSCGFLFVAVSSLCLKRILLRSLKESRDLYEATFHHAAVGMAHLSPEGFWLRVNDAFCRMLGYSACEITALGFREITFPDDLDISEDQLRQVLQGVLPSYTLEKR